MLNVVDKLTTMQGPNEALERGLKDIATELNHLNKTLNLVRRASKDPHYLQGNALQSGRVDVDDVDTFVFGRFLHYIRDRFPSVSDTLQRRIARTMLRRRKRVIVKRDWQEEMVKQPQNAAFVKSDTSPFSKSVGQDGRQEACPREPAARATTFPSDFRASRTLSFDRYEGLNIPPAPGSNARGAYARLGTQRRAASQNSRPSSSASNKSVDKVAAVGAELQKSFETYLQAVGNVICPYCLNGLSAGEVFDEHKWR